MRAPHRSPDLPLLDEHTTVVAADAEQTWHGLVTALDDAFSAPGATAFARLVGCADTRAGGLRPLATGATVPGFHVVRADPGRELVLEGSHRFATYRLAFLLDAQAPGTSRLRAQSSAVFPGLTGRAYRLLVLRTGAHVVGVRRLLGAAKRRSEQPG